MKPKFVTLDGGPWATTMAWASAEAHCSLNVTKQKDKKKKRNKSNAGGRGKNSKPPTRCRATQNPSDILQ